VYVLSHIKEEKSKHYIKDRKKDVQVLIKKNSVYAG
jgi:hypothetical protein